MEEQGRREVFKICTSETPVEIQQEIVITGHEICIEVFTTSNGTVLDWMTRLTQNGIIIIAQVDGYPAAIIMGNRLNKFLPPGHTGSFHIWLCGVREKYRRLGLMTQMLHKLYGIVQKDPHLSDLCIYTISTIPERFPAMPHFLKKHGYIEFTRDEIFDELLRKRTDKIRLFHSIERPSST